MHETPMEFSANIPHYSNSNLKLLSIKTANICMHHWPTLSDQWNYDWGVLLTGIEQVWKSTDDSSYIDYIKHNVDQFILPDGHIRTYDLNEYDLNKISSGKLLFTLYKLSGESRYLEAINILAKQIKSQPRTREGGFWYQKARPYQMWLNSIYMAIPFYAQYADTFDKPAVFDDVAHQILLIDRQARNPEIGLYYHAWDESKMQNWAHPQTGCSPHMLSLSMGWYAMAIVDVLDYLPVSHQTRNRMITILQKLLYALIQVQNKDTGLWNYSFPQTNTETNPSFSATCMILYVIAKASRNDYVDIDFSEEIQLAYSGILQQYHMIDKQGNIHFPSDEIMKYIKTNDISMDSIINESIESTEFIRLGTLLLSCIEYENLYQTNTQDK